MSKYRQWLIGEIELWHRDKIIDAEQARQIAARYSEDTEPTWGKIIFAAVGAIIFGLGIILLFAYNWEAMHRLTKLAIILFAIILAHSLGYYFSSVNSSHKKIGESLHLLGTMLFGAGIWLVAQIYHIDEHFPNALLVWALGALAMAWFLPSLAHTLLAIGLLCLWHWFEVFDFHASNQAGVWIIILGLVPLAWLQRARGTLFLSLAMLLFTYVSSYANMVNHDGSIVTVLFALTCSYIVFSHIAAATTFPQSTDAIRWAGVSVFATLLFICTFSDIDKLHFKAPLNEISVLSWVYFLIPITAAFTLVGVLFLRYRNSLNNNIDLLEVCIVILAFLTSVISVFKLFALHNVSWIIYSLLFLTYSMLLIYRGTQYLRWQSTALGSLLLSAYTFARFMDLFESLLMRGLAFIVIGALLFVVGIYYSRQKKKQTGLHKHTWLQGTDNDR